MLDETNDEPFALLSSMSPKVDKTKKKVPKKKAPSKLAVRTALRRSSIYDNLPSTATNKNIHIVDGSTDTSSDTGGSEKPNSIPRSYIDDLKKNMVLSETKICNIQKWIEEAKPETQENDQNVSVFSTVSSIHGECRIEGKGAVNSTFAVGVKQKRFEECFDATRKSSNEKYFSALEDLDMNDSKDNKNNTWDVMKSLVSKYLHKAPGDDEINDDSFLNNDNQKDSRPDDKIEDSFTRNYCNDDSYNDNKNNNPFNRLKIDLRKGSYLKMQENLAGQDIQDKKTANENSDIIIDDSFEEGNKENINDNGFSSPIFEKDSLSLLDKLYGDMWRKNKDQVIPKSEPRPNKKKTKTVIAPKTEVKPKYANPYIDSEKKRSRNLIGTLESARRKAALESPWMHKLKNLCDSDSDSDTKPNNFERVQLNFEETTPINNHKYNANTYLPPTRLQFNDEDFNNKSKTSRNCDKTSKTNKNSKECTNNVKTSKSEDIKKSNTGGYRSKKVSSSSEEKYDSSSDCEVIGISLPDKVKGKSITKSSNDLPKSDEKSGRTYKNRKFSISSSDSDEIGIIGDKIKGSKTKKKIEPIKSKQRTISSSSSDSSEDKISDVLKRFHINQDNKTSTDTKPLSFLASLSKNVPPAQCDASARVFKSCYVKNRQMLLEKLFKMYNENIFDNAIPADTSIEWSPRLIGSAGYCACRKITRRSGKIEYQVRLVLSSKVLDSADRLRDTLVHEMCHAATYLVNQVSDGHGPYWKAWAAKAMRTYPELPAIKRCHDYAINTKYTYRCSNCGYSFGRHTKSIDLNLKRCGYCRGTLEVFLNKVTKNGETKSVATPKKEPTGFALFVKQNYAFHKAPGLKHADVMKILSKKFQESKTKI